MCLREHRSGTDLAARNGLSKKERGMHRHRMGPQKHGPKATTASSSTRPEGRCALTAKPHHTGQANLEEGRRTSAISSEALLPRGVWGGPRSPCALLLSVWEAWLQLYHSEGRGPWDLSPRCSAYKGLSDISPPCLPPLPSSGVHLLEWQRWADLPEDQGLCSMKNGPAPPTGGKHGRGMGF